MVNCPASTTNVKLHTNAKFVLVERSDQSGTVVVPSKPAAYFYSLLSKTMALFPKFEDYFVNTN